MSPVGVAYVRHPCGWVEPGHTLEFDDTPLSSGTHLPWREEMMDDETVDTGTGLFLVGGVADGPERM